MTQVSSEAKDEPLPSVEYLLFKAPLYTQFSLSDQDVEILYGRVSDGVGRRVVQKIDGYCRACNKDSTFTIHPISLVESNAFANIKNRYAFDNMRVSCARSDYHIIRYYFVIEQMTIIKIGQYPSLADVAIDENRQKYRSVLKGENWAELYKAIGLAAHGEGIGSFVYLRRVFERLIQSRFDEFKKEEVWRPSDFARLRMDEKVAFLKDHLPSYLVETSRIYSIFSLGIHELDNETCLRFFEIGRRSIIIILEDDLKKQQELADRKLLKEAVATFAPKQGEE